MQNLLKNRKNLINLIYNQAKGYLRGKKDDANARLAASKRPQGILFKYKQLIANNNKNIATLDNLENQYRIILLEKARTTDPWDLITKPTLLPNPVAPRKKRMAAIGLISGVFLGFGTSLIVERKKGYY